MNKKLEQLLKGLPDFLGLYAKAKDSAPEIFSNSGKESSPKKWFTVRNSDSDDSPAEITIYEQIGYDYWSDEGTGAADYALALASIPASKPVNVMINSPGGNLWDGLAIAAMNEARGNVTCIVIGVAASAASVIAVKCAKTVMTPSSTMMIHNAQSVCVGSQYDMEKAMECLSVHDEILASLYAKKGGKSDSVYAEAMKKTTWYTADQAKAAGLCDEIRSDLSPTASVALFNFSKFRNSPEDQAKNLGNKNPAKGSPQTAVNNMDKNKIIAVLTGWGITPPENATESDLLALIQAGPKKANKPESASADSVTPEQLVAFTTELKAMRDREAAARETRVTAEIDRAIAELRIPTNSRDAWLSRAKADETVVALLPSAPPARPEPVGIELVSADYRNILKEFESFNGPTNDLRLGNAFDGKRISNAATQKAQLFRKHESKIMEVMAANTMPAELQRQVILQGMIREFARRTLPLTAFSTKFENVPLQGTDKVNISFYALDATASSAWVPATGYVAGNTTTAQREITINKRQVQGASFTSSEMARQPFLNSNNLMMLKAEKLAYDVFVDTLSVVTLANFGAAATTKLASLWTSDDLADLKLACKTWPTAGRSLIVDSSIDTALLKDGTFKNNLSSGIQAVVQQGSLGPLIYGFNYLECPNIPTNAQNLIGFAVFQSAILFASAPIAPAEDVLRAGTTYELMVDPVTGVTLEYRAFGSNNLDTSNRFVESNYGYALGYANALKRIVSA